jgi:hypothetical protein
MQEKRPRVPFILYALFCAGLAAIVFSPGLGGGFVLDDFPTLVENDLLKVKGLDYDEWMHAIASFHAGRGSRPLAMLSFTLDYWLQGGLEPSAFKITNLVIHVLTTLVLAFFLRRLFLVAGWPLCQAVVGAAALALLWGVHPLQVSGVLYVVQRMQMLVTLFVILVLWAYLALRQAQIEGRRGWPYGVLAAIGGLLALGSKEDAVLIPAYMLVMELTVLQFKAASAARRRSLRQTFALFAIMGTALYLFWVLPTYWVVDAYPGRDFGSAERLLTQARVLVMHLVQILVPWPGLMPFHYDQLEVSRGAFDPLTTLPSILLLAGLLVWAWRWRNHRPVFALGTLLFLAGHFLTSNVIPLELAFEHRNHFALVGVLLAVADLVRAMLTQQRVASWLPPLVASVAVALVASAGAMRAYYWGNPVRFAQYSTWVAPKSQRAWLTLGQTWFNLAGREAGAASPYLDKAIEAVEQGASHTGSISAYFNSVLYRTIQGTVQQQHWDQLFQRVAEGPLPARSESIVWTALSAVRADIGLDEERVLRLIDSVLERVDVNASTWLNIGWSVFLSMDRQDAALPYFLRAAYMLPPGDPAIRSLQEELAQAGLNDWVEQINLANAHERREERM